MSRKIFFALFLFVLRYSSSTSPPPPQPPSPSREERCFQRRMAYQKCRDSVVTAVPNGRFTCSDLDRMFSCSESHLLRPGCTYGYTRSRFEAMEKDVLRSSFPSSSQRCPSLQLQSEVSSFSSSCSSRDALRMRYRTAFCADLVVALTPPATGGCTSLKKLKKSCLDPDVVSCFVPYSEQYTRFELDLAAYSLQSLANDQNRSLSQMQFCSFFQDRGIRNIQLDFIPANLGMPTSSPSPPPPPPAVAAAEGYFALDYESLWSDLASYRPKYLQLTDERMASILSGVRESVLSMMPTATPSSPATPTTTQEQMSENAFDLVHSVVDYNIVQEDGNVTVEKVLLIIHEHRRHYEKLFDRTVEMERFEKIIKNSTVHKQIESSAAAVGGSYISISLICISHLVLGA